jgi:hypothetical protein
MRALFGGLAVLLGAVSISLAARYGYKGADTVVDGVISAVVFGAIALCAFLFDGAAVRLWFQGHRVGSLVIGLIAAAALIVTFTNSLGAIASRADSTLAARSRVADAHKDDRAELRRLESALTGLGSFTPTDKDAVAAAKRAADTATSNRTAECDKRGPNCRARELDEQTAASKLATVTAAKATTDRATQLETEIRSARARLNAGEPISNANPLGNALALLLGAGAAALTAWQQAIVAAVFELCLVGVMVIYELLGHVKVPTLEVAAKATTTDRRMAAQQTATVIEADKLLPPPASIPKKVGTTARKVGSLKAFVLDRLFPGDGERTEMKALMRDYRAWCAQNGSTPLELNGFLDGMEKICRQTGVEIEVGDDRRVYCVGVKLGGGQPASLH